MISSVTAVRGTMSVTGVGKLRRWPYGSAGGTSMYLGYLVEWLSSTLSAVGRWFGDLAHCVTHDPWWGGAAVAVVVLLLVLAYLRNRVSR